MNRARRVLLLGLALLAAAGLLRLRFEANVLGLLPSDLPQVRGLEIFLAHFGLPSELIVTLEGPDSESTARSAESLAQHLRDKTSSGVRSAPPWAENPGALVDLAAHGLLNRPPERFRETLGKFQPQRVSQSASAAIEALSTTLDPAEIARLGYDPLGLLEGLPRNTDPFRADREFVADDGKFRVLYVTPSGAAKNRPPPSGWMDAVIGEIQTWRAADPLREAIGVAWTGEPAFVHEISRAMSSDMRWSSLLSLGFAAALFFVVHRRVRPLARMMAYVVASFLGALGLVAWIFPDLSIISVGFAAILAGVTVDYGFLLYQSRLRLGADVAAIRRAAAPGILAAAATSSAAFASLNFSGLPGIAQLGTTVAAGVAIGAFLMVRCFAADLARMALPTAGGGAGFSPRFFQAGVVAALIAAGVSLGGLVWKGMPGWAADTQSMRPKESVAYPALERFSRALGETSEVLQFVAVDSSVGGVADKLSTARQILESARGRGEVEAFEIPDALWPNPDWRSENLSAAREAAREPARIQGLLTEAGFSGSGTALAAGVLDSWNKSVGDGFPAGEAFEWIARRTMSRDGGEFAASGFFTRGPQGGGRLAAELSDNGLLPASWSELGQALADHALTRGIATLAVFFAVMAVVLAATFRNALDPLLVLGANLLGLAMLNGLMALVGMEWNFMNLCALTLTMGLGVDYGIHVVFALRSRTGDRAAALADVGKALGLCAATTIAGFASLGAAGTEGLASLGRACALGVAINALVALFLLPSAWRLVHRKNPAAPGADA